MHYYTVPFKLSTLPHQDLLTIMGDEEDKFLLTCLEEYIDAVRAVISLHQHDYIPEYVLASIISKIEEECDFALWTMQDHHPVELGWIQNDDVFIYHLEHTKHLLHRIESHYLRLFSRSLTLNESINKQLNN